MCVLGCAPLLAPAQQTDPNRVYRCPDNSYTNLLSVVRQKNCKPVDNANISVVAPSKHRPSAPVRAGSGAAKVSPAAQSDRDAEARRLLESELQTQQARLVELQKAYNNGQPERLGSEANYQKYLDRVADMKRQIEMTTANIQALQRELQRHGQ